ncbi:MAG: LysR family transcriptional regulator [Tissierellaceae bacterium]|nr:LysR family transcriptional regulator [Tissierellaceae bacterium]
MEIKNLNSFLQVATTQNFTKAASILGYSQSNISVHIQQLEEELGVLLFNRLSKKVVLTQYGEALIPYAKQCLSSALKIESLFQNDTVLKGNIRIGFTESTFERFFKKTIINFHEKYPHVSTEISVDATSRLLKQLNSSELDIVILIGVPQNYSNIKHHYIKKSDIYIVASANHPLALKQEEILPFDLYDKEFILTENTSPYNISFQQFLMEKNIHIRSYIKLQSPEMIISLLKQGSYLSVLPDFTIKNAVSSGELVKLKVPDYSGNQAIQILTHKNTVISPPMNGFLRQIEMVIEKNEI